MKFHHSLGLGMMAVLVACSSSGGKPAAADEATQRVTASQGGTLTTPGGMVLQIGPGALYADTDVRVASVTPAGTTDTFVAGVAFGPDGTMLARPARVRIPLPAGWSGDSVPEIHEFNGTTGEAALPTGMLATLVGSPGAYAAEASVAHFCGLVLSQNCHAGTIKHILSNFEGRGCDRAAILRRVNERYPEIGFDESRCVSAGPPSVQALVDSYFEDIGAWGPGQDLAPDVLSRLLGYARAGRQVVLTFDNGPPATRGGPHDFYPSGSIPHSAVLKVDDHGAVQIKNTIFTVTKKLKEWGGGEVVVEYPADRLNDFRRLQSGVAVELAICGRPGCLSDPVQNNFGIDAYSPLAQRPVPYPSVRIYVERAGGPPSSPCAVSTLSALVDVEGYLPSHSYVPLTVLGLLGSTASAAGFPGFIATTADVPFSGFDPATQDVLSMAMAKNLPGPGTYALGEDWDLVANPATLVFSSPSISRTDRQGPVVFVSTTGSLRLKSYGAAVGSSLRGEFEANIVGLDWRPIPGGEDQAVEILGTVAGSFDVVIVDLGR